MSEVELQSLEMLMQRLFAALAPKTRQTESTNAATENAKTQKPPFNSWARRPTTAATRNQSATADKAKMLIEDIAIDLT